MNIRKKDASFSISLIIFVIFSLIFFIIMSTVISYSYHKSSRNALKTANHLMEKSSEEVFMKIQNLYEPMLYITDQAVDLPILAEKPTLQNHPGETFFINTMEAYPQIQCVYIGYDDGDFYEIISFSGISSEEIQNTVNAPEEARIGILRQFRVDGRGKPVRLWKFLNQEYQTIGSLQQRDTNYDPRNRPWFTLAKGSDRSVKTRPYLFSNIKKTGMTFSRKIDGSVSGVLGADILLDELSLFLEGQCNDLGGLLFIFNSDKIISSCSGGLQNIDINAVSAGSSADLPADGELQGFISYLDTLDLSEDHDRIMTNRGVPYMIKVKKLPEAYSSDEYLFLAIPRDNILTIAGHTATETALISLVLGFMAFPLIFYVSRRISLPMSRLEREVEKIADFNLEGDIQIQTYIKEIGSLSDGVMSMKRGLRSFSRYVPTKHVKKLMKSNAEQILGGVSREMTFLFTDIKDFTGIAERSSPEILVRHLSDYFSVVSSEILNRFGTIDKYIGDAVMGFWNAPEDDPDHTLHACEAALNAQAGITVLNKARAMHGLCPFHTRIGIDTGVAVVGNIGSSERMNYTAIGDAVNSTSRLEGINKIYGTNIIIGQKVAWNLTDRFLTRPLEKIIVRGKSEVQTIYELVGYSHLCSPEDHAFAKGFSEALELYYDRRWKEAEKRFMAAREINADDKALNSLLESCRQLQTQYGREDWDGVRILYRK